MTKELEQHLLTGIGNRGSFSSFAAAIEEQRQGQYRAQQALYLSMCQLGVRAAERTSTCAAAAERERQRVAAMEKKKLGAKQLVQSTLPFSTPAAAAPGGSAPAASSGGGGSGGGAAAGSPPQLRFTNFPSYEEWPGRAPGYAYYQDLFLAWFEAVRRCGPARRVML